MADALGAAVAPFEPPRAPLVFWDKRCINNAEKWLDSLHGGLEGASLVVLLLSDGAIADIIANAQQRQDNMLIEIETALQNRRLGKCIVFTVVLQSKEVSPSYSFDPSKPNCVPDTPHFASRISIRATLRTVLCDVQNLRISAQNRFEPGDAAVVAASAAVCELLGSQELRLQRLAAQRQHDSELSRKTEMLNRVMAIVAAGVRVGEGASSVVFQGRLFPDDPEDRPVAVKVVAMAAGNATSLAKQFTTELEILKLVQHKNVVRFHDYFLNEETQMQYLLMQYCPGGSLEMALSPGGSGLRSWEARVKIAEGVAEGLSYLHAKGIYHRDIKPGNILLTADLEPRIADFGVSRLLFPEEMAANQTSHVTQSSKVGTYGYWAPEVGSQKFGPKTDIFSLGVCILNLATGLPATENEVGIRTALERRIAADGSGGLKGVALSLCDSRCFWTPAIAEGLLELGLRCTQTDRSLRPPLTEITGLLRDLQQPLGGASKFGARPDLIEADSGSSGGLDCFACCAALRNTLLLPCNHALMCWACSEGFLSRMEPCPICRSPIQTLNLLDGPVFRTWHGPADQPGAGWARPFDAKLTAIVEKPAAAFQAPDGVQTPEYMNVPFARLQTAPATAPSLVDVGKGTLEWRFVAHHFASMGLPLTSRTPEVVAFGINTRLMKVERVMNVELWNSYIESKASVRGDPNELWLWHGSAKEKKQPPRIWGGVGLDPRLANPESAFGKGLYFAESPIYCNRQGYYASQRESKVRQVFLVRLIAGKTEKISNWSMELRGPSDGYDSVVAAVGGPGLTYVSYTPFRNYPSYLVSYELTPPGIDAEAAAKHARNLVTPAALEESLKKQRGDILDCGPRNHKNLATYDIRLKPDGEVDLQSTIDSCAAGSRILLEPGIHRLKENDMLVLSEKTVVHIYGEGGEATLACMVYSLADESSINGVCICDPGVVIYHLEGGHFIVSGGEKGSRWEGQETVARNVTREEAEKEGKGPSSAAVSRYKGGYCALRVATGALIVQNCELTTPEASVIIINGRAAPTIRNCLIHDGSGCGLMIYGESSKPVLEYNKIFNNGSHGILINDDECAPVIHGNEVYGNKGWGICLPKGFGGSSAVIGNNNVTAKNKEGEISSRLLTGSLEPQLLSLLTFKERN